MLEKVISGGQTGVDQAALRAAHACGIETGGWAPAMWQTEDGPAPWLTRYGMLPHSGSYAARTTANVADSDATLVLFVGGVTGGTGRTVKEAERLGKPCLIINLGAVHDEHGVRARAEIREFLVGNEARTLNVAGPRESKHPGIGAKAEAFLVEVFRALKEKGS